MTARDYPRNFPLDRRLMLVRDSSRNGAASGDDNWSISEMGRVIEM